MESIVGFYKKLSNIALNKMHEADDKDDDKNKNNPDNQSNGQDDVDIGNNNPTPDDGGGTGNIGGSDDGGLGGSSGSSDSSDLKNGKENPDVEDSIDTANVVSNNIQNAPKNLVLNDGTNTGVAVDSKNQSVPLDDIDNQYSIKFDSGNWSSFVNSAETYSKNVNTTVQQFIPLAEVSLIELFGNSNAYKRVSFNAEPDETTNSVNVDVVYQASPWIGTDIPIRSIQMDQDYVRNRISNIQGLNIKIQNGGIRIDTNDGTLHISANISQGAQAPVNNVSNNTVVGNPNNGIDAYNMIQQ